MDPTEVFALQVSMKMQEMLLAEWQDLMSGIIKGFDLYLHACSCSTYFQSLGSLI